MTDVIHGTGDEYDDSIPTPEHEDFADNAEGEESEPHNQHAEVEEVEGALDEDGNPVHSDDDGSEDIDADESTDEDVEEDGPEPYADEEVL